MSRSAAQRACSSSVHCAAPGGATAVPSNDRHMRRVMPEWKCNSEGVPTTDAEMEFPRRT